MQKALDLFNSLLNKKISRKTFIKLFVALVAYIAMQSRLLRFAFAKSAQTNGREKKDIKGNYDMVIAKGPDSYRNTIEAVKGRYALAKLKKAGVAHFCFDLRSGLQQPQLRLPERGRRPVRPPGDRYLLTHHRRYLAEQLQLDHEPEG